MKKRILVTGGAGYIGAHAALEVIRAGHEPILLDNLSRSDMTLVEGLRGLTGQELIFVQGDSSDVETLRGLFKRYNRIDAVMHFAALKSVGESVREPLLYHINNVNSLTSLLRVMKEYNIRDLIFSSSCTVYGQPDVIPVTELTPMKPAESPYGATKQVCERVLADVHSTGFRVVSLRYFNPIGADSSAAIGELPIGVPGNLVPYITQTAAGKRDKVTVFGNDYSTPDGSCIRDYIHVTDLAKAHLAALDFLDRSNKETLCEAFNLGSGKGVSVLELIHKFIAVTGVKLKYTIGPRRAGDVERIYADPAKANRVLGWQVSLTTEDALRAAWNWEQRLISHV